ncbi:MAG: NAD(P)H-dependent glycerol-3-phosphate dehydrogenase [Chitinophagaceae bacterium]|nr:NAD(P)H-dependent glycerol-3-phosphate dehydrogenase [Chitinophagaceae bacterium]
MKWSNMYNNNPVGVIGTGSFGIVIANIIAKKRKVFLYARNQERQNELEQARSQTLHKNIIITTNIQYVLGECSTIFPIIPSLHFRDSVRKMSPFLKPYHILIHGTKGFDTMQSKKEFKKNDILSRHQIKTMSEVITEETSVVRIGCLSGPNLAKEMQQKLPAASVIASHFDEVITEGIQILKNDTFIVFGNKDLLGVELCGSLKNIIAIGAGLIYGLSFGENAKASLISRGLVEMMYIGKVMGANTKSFMGLAGVGDIIATCSSTTSRNFTVGVRLAKGEKIEDIIGSIHEVAEGVKTIDTIIALSKYYKIRCPISEVLFKIIHREMSVSDASHFLMRFSSKDEIGFID